MTRLRTFVTAIAGLLTTAALAGAQPETPAPPETPVESRVEFAITGVLMRPQGDLQQALPFGFGGGFYVLRSIGSGLLAVGADTQLLLYLRSWKQQYPDKILTGHGLVRVRRRTGRIRPYVEALAGIKGFASDTSVGTSSYGIGVGWQFPPRRGTQVETTQQDRVEIGVRYLRGGRARVGGSVASSSHSVVVHVGVVNPF